MLQVTHSLTLGQRRYDSHAARVVVRRSTLPGVDRLEVTLPRAVDVRASAGDDVALSLDAGDGATDVFTGTVTRVRRRFDATVVVAHDAAHRLARYRPSMSLEQLTVGDVVRRLCGDVDVETDTVDDGPTLARYVALARATALEEIARLAGLAGATATITAGGAVRVAAEPADERRLRFGREVLELDAAGAAAAEADFVVVGEGAAEPGEGAALWPTADFWAGGAPAPGPGARRRAAHEVRSTSDATAAGEAWAHRDAERRGPVRLRCWLQPTLAPGDTVEVADAPGDLALGPVAIRHVVHHLDAGSAAVTDAWGAAAPVSGGPLGAAVSAAGSLR